MSKTRPKITSAPSVGHLGDRLHGQGLDAGQLGGADPAVGHHAFVGHRAARRGPRRVGIYTHDAGEPQPHPARLVHAVRPRRGRGAVGGVLGQGRPDRAAPNLIARGQRTDGTEVHRAWWRRRRPGSRRSGPGSRPRCSAGLGPDARDRVRRPQRGARGQGVRLVLPADHRRGRVPAGRDAGRRVHDADAPPRHHGTGAGVGEDRVRLGEGGPACDRHPRARPDVLLRELVHRRPPARCTCVRGGGPPAARSAPTCAARSGSARSSGTWRCSDSARRARRWRLDAAVRPRGARRGSTALWWLTAWAMLLRQVRMRALWPVGLVTGVAMGLYGLSSTVWMPSTVYEEHPAVRDLRRRARRWSPGSRAPRSASWSAPAPGRCSPPTRGPSVASSAGARTTS